MKKQKRTAQNAVQNRNKRRFDLGLRLKIIASVVILVGAVVMCVALVAAFDIADPLGVGDFFRSAFSIYRNTPAPEPTESTYPDEPAAQIDESVTQHGFTVSIVSAVTDGMTANILVDIIGPEDAKLDTLPLAFAAQFEKLRFEGQENDHIRNVTCSFAPIADNDGKDNTSSVMIQYTVYPLFGSKFTLADGRKRVLQLQDLHYIEREYPYSRCNVAEGNWKFEFVFSVVDNREVELLETPIAASYIQTSGNRLSATITSIQIKGFSASVYYRIEASKTPEAGHFGALKIVMTDGSVAYAGANGAAHDSAGNYISYVFQMPINYEDIDTVYIGDAEIYVADISETEAAFIE